MRSFRFPTLVLAFLALAVTAPIPAQEKKNPAPPPPSIEQLVADLGHERYATRENAQHALWLRGDAAIPALERALDNESPEIVRRARNCSTNSLGEFARIRRPRY